MDRRERESLMARLRFAEAVCGTLTGAERDRIISFQCPLCGQEALAVWLHEGPRRGRCYCGARMDEEVGP